MIILRLMKSSKPAERINGANWYMKIAQSKTSAGAARKRTASPVMRAERESFFETLAAPAWRLPGGVRLAEFALRGGFVASSLLVRGERDR
jgi:hypothetical protein